MNQSRQDQIEAAQRAVAEHYKIPGNEAGGTLHIVTDDYNIEDHFVHYCLECATERGDASGVKLAELLLTFTEEERHAIVCRCDVLDWTPDNDEA